MAKALSRRPLTAEAWVDAPSVRVGFVMGKVVLGQVLLRLIRVSPVNIMPPWLSIFIYLWGMNNRPVGSRSSET
jgi:hypothetical protein